MTIREMWKSIIPAVLAVLAVCTSWIASGTLDEVELRIALAGVVTSGLTYFVRNATPDAMAKALVPAGLTAVAVLADWVASGALDVDAARIAVAGLVTSFITWLIPNEDGPPVLSAR